jgi:Cytochrome P460
MLKSISWKDSYRTMKMLRWVPVVIITALILSGCTGKETAVKLVPTDYSQWKHPVEEMLTYEIPGHTLDARLIYINEIGTGVTAGEVNGQVRYDYPVGTIVLKENYETPESEIPKNITVMIKDPSHPDAKGGWVWIAKNVGTGEETIFDEEFCITCHQNANERHPYGDKNSSREYRDYVFYPWRSN